MVINSMSIESNATEDEKKFHGWRLLGVIFLVCFTIAIAAAIIDSVMIGPL